MNNNVCIFLVVTISIASCKKENNPVYAPAQTLTLSAITINGKPFTNPVYTINNKPQITINFSQPLQQNTLAQAIQLKDATGTIVPVSATLLQHDSAALIQASTDLSYLSRYDLTISTSLKSAAGGNLDQAVSNTFITSLDSSRKFPPISDAALLDTVQKRTFNYFWEFAHPVSGLARESKGRHADNIITIGGSGFGIMALLVAIERNFITRAQGLERVQKIIFFLKNNADTFHGAFPHWLDGATGKTIPFSANDNGADLVETAYLMMGLLAARQYFGGTNVSESTLRNDINLLWNAVEWNWFQQNAQPVLYWHWSPDQGWIINQKIQGWNECLVTYILAASSTTHGITKDVYDKGWTNNGAIKNGKTFYNYALPLGEDYGGPLFFSHYSFLGINPNGLSDAYANYETQTKNHTLINYTYCKTNPKNFYGYSDSIWGLTASNIKDGYAANSPTNDKGYITPTAAISSLPYTPNESMAALKFYYYVLGDKIFKEYGFTDAFTLDVIKNKDAWFDNTYLAIDQGPEIVMIENYRTKLLWNLFMSAPELKAGLVKLGFAGF